MLEQLIGPKPAFTKRAQFYPTRTLVVVDRDLGPGEAARRTLDFPVWARQNVPGQTLAEKRFVALETGY
jgi:hypothetical protein